MQWLKKYRWPILICALIGTLFIWHVALGNNGSGILKFAVLDIGQGDAIYIEAPNGRQIMFDSGPGDVVLAQLAKVMPIADHSIDMLVITNPDKDHIGGFIPIIDKYDVGAVLEPGTFNESATYRNLEEKIKSKNIPDIIARQGMKIVLDGKQNVYIDILFPDRDVSSWTTNDGSIVAKLIYGNESIMLTGDATRATELILTKTIPNQLKSTILKVGHHGSHTSSSPDFIKLVAPDFAVISLGAKNSYGHPHKETLRSLSNFNIETFRTDELGTIIFESDGKSFYLKQ
jgi:competence protein ComEC